MALTIEQLIDQARFLLQDARVPYRYPTAQMVSAVNLAMGDAWRIRPDLFITKYADGVPQFEEGTAATDLFPLPTQFTSPVVSFLVGWVASADDEFTEDGRAAMFQRRFVETLTAGG